jgi:hypothetical protein
MAWWWLGPNTLQEAAVGRWFEDPREPSGFGYDPHAEQDGQQPAADVTYPPTHTPSPVARINPDAMPPEDEHRHGGAP